MNMNTQLKHRILCTSALIFIALAFACSLVFATTANAENEDDGSSNEYYDLWFDGTDGMETSIANNGLADLPSYYDGATNEHAQVPVSEGKVTLPDSAGTPKNYEYVLNGWYDITNNKYYDKDKLGTEIEVTGNAVFYADWTPKSYNLGNSSREKVSKQPDTSDFITTQVFDYNELFNLRSANLNERSLESNTHLENWSLNSDSLDFAFLNWAYNDAAGYGNIGSLGNLDSNNQNKSDITQGILNNDIKEALFTHSSDLGRTYVGEGDYLYQYVDDSSDENYGYYYYDSSKNGASYNQKDGRFYLYAQPEKVHEQKRSGTSWTDKSPTKETTAFLPFNDDDSGVYNEKDGSINYWFGMQSTVDFWLPNNSGTGGNKADTGKEMEFKFSGDDDVWVFVDDQLVLDLGGIHGARGGTINFSTGKVETEISKEKWKTEDLSTVEAGNHTLTIYYLERGSSQSNCSIYFNIAPKYALTLMKKDAESGAALAGAEFGVYADAACTEPAKLWNNAEETGSTVHEFTTNSDGVATGYGLVAGNTYYVKELKAPDNYIGDTDKVYSITLNNDGTVVEVEGVDLAVDASSKKLILTVTNTKKTTPPSPDPDPDPDPDPEPEPSPDPEPDPDPEPEPEPEPSITPDSASETDTAESDSPVVKTSIKEKATPSTDDSTPELVSLALAMVGTACIASASYLTRRREERR